MKNNNPEILLKCSSCGKSLTGREVANVENSEEKITFHGSCSECGTKTVIFVLEGQGGMVSLGMATDLDRSEIIERLQQEAISTDEVLDAHQLVSAEKGIFGNFFKNC